MVLWADGDLLTPNNLNNPTLTTLTLEGDIDCANNIITNIGAAGTDFTAAGGLTLADALIATTGTFSGNALIGTTIPATGSPRLDVVGSTEVVSVFGNVTDDAINKLAFLGGRHFTNAEEPIFIIGGRSITGDTVIRIGGGSTLLNTATIIEYYTAANTTTLTGTLAADITGVGTASILRLRGDITIDKDLNHDGSNVGFYATAPIAQQTGVGINAGAIHAALVALGLITA
ncbi:hypothetical protein LCGC14_3114280 [marine sediment metagenome]|uniref:Uncharacterized protein n=1 Tax=marine sediment metagenome TaxID=412755 RepID=A0A0F8YU45_9ZZZZ